MAEEISDDKFKSEVIRFIEVANQKFDGLSSDVRTNTFKLDHIENRLIRVEEKVVRVEEKVDRIVVDLKGLTSEVKILSGQFQDVGGMAIDDHKRIDELEERVGILESEAR